MRSYIIYKTKDFAEPAKFSGGGQYIFRSPSSADVTRSSDALPLTERERDTKAWGWALERPKGCEQGPH